MEKLSREKEPYVLANKKLVYYVLWRMGISAKDSEFEDLLSVGMIGLIKAAIHYDEKKEKAFSTYAYPCIRNEVLMYFRAQKKLPSQVVSWNEPLTAEGEEEWTIENLLADPHSDYVRDIAENDVFSYWMSMVLNAFAGKARLALLYRFNQMTCQEIGDELHITRARVSAILLKSLEKWKELMHSYVRRNEFYRLEKKENAYLFCIKTYHTQLVHEMVKEVHYRFSNRKDLPCYELVEPKKDYCCILIQEHENSFFFLAKIIQEIEEKSRQK